MNPSEPQNPGEALDTQLTALLLGELPGEEASALRRQIGREPELKARFEQLQAASILVREALAIPDLATSAGELAPRLSAENRERLKACFKTLRPPAFETKAPSWFGYWWLPAAAVALMLVSAIALLFPGLSRGKARGVQSPITLAFKTATWDEDTSVAASPSPLATARSATITSSVADGEPPQPSLNAPSFEGRVDMGAGQRFMRRYGAGVQSAPPESAVGQAESYSVPELKGASEGLKEASEGLVPLEIKLPAPAFTGTPKDFGQVLTKPSPGSGTTRGVAIAPNRGRVEVGLQPIKQPAAAAMPQPRADAIAQAQRAGGGGLGVVAEAGSYNWSHDSLETRLGRGFNSETENLKGVTPETPPAAREKVPQGMVLGDVPLFGTLFRSESRTPEAFVPQARGDVAPVPAKELTDNRLGETALGYYDQKAETPERRRLGWPADAAKSAETAGKVIQEDSYYAAGREAKGKISLADERFAGATRALGLDVLSTNSLYESVVLESRRKLAEMDRASALDLGAEPAVKAVPSPKLEPQPEVVTRDNPFSTFSLNVSDVSFKLAAVSIEKGALPQPGSIRSEEFINAFDYRDPEPAPGLPIAFAWERARYPFAHNRDVLRFSVKTAAQGRQSGKPINLVLLLDNSGSMERADRVGIIREALGLLGSQLQSQDKLSVITFSRIPTLRVDGRPGNEAGELLREISELTPEGGTNLEESLRAAYETALRHYAAGGINRVVLLTDGAANLGEVNAERFRQLVQTHRKQGVALDAFGIGWEGLNDDLLEALTRNGDGRYAFLNSPGEAATDFVARLTGALRVAAADVKVQVEFNPDRVNAYRQVGYAKHQLTKEQFRDNAVDAAEIGAAEAGNGIYIVEVNPGGTGPLATVRVRYQNPETRLYHEREWPVPYSGLSIELSQAPAALRLASVAAAFSETLAESPYAVEVASDALLSLLAGVPEVYGADSRPKKLEWMVRQTRSLTGK